MYSYKVKEKGFFNGKIYDPNGKRPVLHRDEPFPKKNGKEQVPSWLEPVKPATSQKPASSNGEPTVKELKAKLKEMGVEFNSNANKAALTQLLADAEAQKEQQSDQQEIANASFMGEGEQAGSAVETL